MDRAKLERAIKIAREKAGATQAFWWDITPEFLRLVFDAAEAHLATLPKTKMVAVWRLEWVSRSPGGDHLMVKAFRTHSAADEYAEHLRNGAQSHERWMCIHVTGPHLQEVPSPASSPCVKNENR